jgi:hypothetical protein
MAVTGRVGEPVCITECASRIVSREGKECSGSVARAGLAQSARRDARVRRRDVAVSASHYRTENKASCKRIMKEVMKRRKEEEKGVRSRIVQCP